MPRFRSSAEKDNFLIKSIRRDIEAGQRVHIVCPFQKKARLIEFSPSQITKNLEDVDDPSDG